MQVPYPIIIPVKKPQYHHPTTHHDHHHHHLGHDGHHLSTYDHHTDFTNNKYQQVSAQRPQQSSEQSSSSSSASSSNEYQDFRPQLREAAANLQQEQTKLFAPSNSEQNPYNQQHQLHHQQQYAQLRRDLLTRERMRASSEDESESESSEFRPMMSSQSAEYMSPSSNVETVVPPPPNQQTRSSFHINVPNESETPKEATTSSAQTGNQYTHNIEIPVQFYRIQPIENGEGFTLTS